MIPDSDLVDAQTYIQCPDPKPQPDVNPQPSTLNLANGIMHKCESDHAITARNACLELPAYTTL
jgi:hypothetical protein